MNATRDPHALTQREVHVPESMLAPTFREQPFVDTRALVGRQTCRRATTLAELVTDLAAFPNATITLTEASLAAFLADAAVAVTVAQTLVVIAVAVTVA